MGRLPKITDKAANRNRNIRNYFSVPSQPPTAARPPGPSNHASSGSLSPLSDTPSLPTAQDKPRPRTPESPNATSPQSSSSQDLSDIFKTPAKSETSEGRRPISRDAVIPASDDDDSSDNDLLELEQIVNIKPASSTSSRCPPTQDPCATPEAKRRRANHFNTPLSIRQRPRLFPMDQFLKDAREHEELEAELRRFKAAEEDESLLKQEHLKGDTLRHTLMHTVGDETHNVDKVVRAIERTDAGSGRRGWYFFHKNAVDVSAEADDSFPAAIATKICGTRVKKSQELDMSVLDLSLKLRGNRLPDELFAWLLDEICVEESGLRRTQYCDRLLQCTPDDFTRHVNRGSLERLFRRLGASPDINNLDSELATVECPKVAYYQRRWDCLHTLLDVLYDISHNLGGEAIEYCVQMLLRIAVDDEILRHPEVSSSHPRLLARLVGNYRRMMPLKWDEFCEVMCSSIFTSFTSTPMRLQALRRLPSWSNDVHDLRRRMAAAFLFHDTGYAEQNVDIPLALQDIRHFLRHSDIFRGRSISDFTEFTAYLGLLDIVIDVGRRPPPDRQSENRSLAHDFNEKVDGVVYDLKKLASNIPNKASSVGPYMAKMEIDWIRERLNYNVRTRPRPKDDVYDKVKKKQEPAIDRSLPRQQNYMRSFLKDRNASGDARARGCLFDETTRPIQSKKRPREDGANTTALDVAL